MESEPMLTPREKNPCLPEKFSPAEDRTHDTASSRTVSPTHYQHAILAPILLFNVMDVVFLFLFVCLFVFCVYDLYPYPYFNSHSAIRQVS